MASSYPTPKDMYKQSLKYYKIPFMDHISTPHTRMTSLASLKDSLEGCDLEEEQKKGNGPAKKQAKTQGGRKPRAFLMHMQEDKPKQNTIQNGPRTMLGAVTKGKYNFSIEHQLPFIEFPIGDGLTSDDVALLSGLLDTGGCCNMGNLSHHQAIAEQFPQFVDELICLETERFETINIGGLKDGVTLTHMIPTPI